LVGDLHIGRTLNVPSGDVHQVNSLL
jgi:hypothetical protein